MKDVLDRLDEELGPHFFPTREEGKDPRSCPSCSEGRLSLKLGRFGAFIGCSRYPDCRFTRKLGIVGAEGDEPGAADAGPVILGNDPETGLPVSLRKGPYGTYLQLGDNGGEEKPKRSSLPKGLSPADVDLAKALALLNLPRELGPHPETGDPITAGIGRFGPYVRHASTYKTIPADEDVLNIGMNRAVALLAEAAAGGGGRRQKAKPLRVLGAHPADNGPVELYEGRYGPYVKHGKVNATLPQGADLGSYTLEQALPLIAARSARSGGRSSRSGPRAARADSPAAVAKAGKTKKASRTAGTKARPATAARKPAAGAKRKAASAPRRKASGKAADSADD